MIKVYKEQLLLLFGKIEGFFLIFLMHPGQTATISQATTLFSNPKGILPAWWTEDDTECHKVLFRKQFIKTTW